MTRARFATTVLALLVCTTPLEAQRSTRRVIDAAGIAKRAWHRVGDIVEALPPGTVASVDGFNQSLTGSRIGFTEASGSPASWLVRLDGQSMPVSIGGLWILDAIPVAITQIDSVVITDGPAIVDGRTTFLGTIDLFTRRPRRGPSLAGDYQHGDESGDPGPYRYTPRATPNVEKIGPFASGAAAYGIDRATIDVGARYSSVNITDPRIQAQFPGGFGSLQSDVNASGGSGVITGHAAGGDHFLIAGRGRFTGLMHFPDDGSSPQGRVVTSHAGLSGRARLNGMELRYGAVLTTQDLDSLGPAPPGFPTQTRTIGDVFVEGSPTRATVRIGAGLNVGRQETPTETNQRRTERAWATYANARQSATLSIEHAIGAVRVGGMLRHEATLADSERLAISVTAFNSSTDANNAWMESGFETATTSGPSTGMADLRIELTTHEFLRVTPTWYGRAFVVSGDDDQPDFRAVAAGMVASTPPGRRSSAFVRGEVSQMLGDASRGELTTPSGFIEATGSTTTAGRFLLALSARYAPHTEWDQFSSPDVPATQRIDLSVNKPMWRDRIRAQLIIRNALNAADRTHPLGAQWNLRTHLAVTIDLPPFPRGTP